MAITMPHGVTGGGLDPASTDPRTIQFYQYWSTYLRPQMGMLISAYNSLLDGLALVLYSISVSMEDIFFKIFGLLGLFSDTTDQSSQVGQIFHWMQILGTTVFGLALVFYAVTSIWSTKSKWKRVLENIVILFFVVGFLPLAVNSFAGGVKTAIDETKSAYAQNTNNSISLQPFIDNIVSTKALYDGNFDTNKYQLDGNGYLVGNPGALGLNNITDKNLSSLNFGGSFGVAHNTKDADQTTFPNGDQALFMYELNSATGNTSLKQLKSTTLGMLGDNYPQYTINWVPIFGILISLIILYTTMSLKTVESITQIFITTIIAPILGAIRATNSKKMKELIQTIFYGLISVYLELIVIYALISAMQWVGTSGIFDGLNSVQQGIGICVVYFGMFFGVFKGVAVIERFTGVSSSHSDALQTVAAMYFGTKTAGSAVNMAKHVGLATGKGAVGATKYLANTKPGLKARQGVNLASHATLGGAKTVAGKVGNKIMENPQMQDYAQSLKVTGGAFKDGVQPVKDLNNDIKESVVNVAERGGYSQEKWNQKFEAKAQQKLEKKGGLSNPQTQNTAKPSSYKPRHSSIKESIQKSKSSISASKQKAGMNGQQAFGAIRQGTSQGSHIKGAPPEEDEE